jgi:lipoprotein-anchoring transpeptidase ErfK/SrfK
LPESVGADENVWGTAVPPTATPRPTRNPIQPKNPLSAFSGKEGEPRATWTLTPIPTNTPTPTVTPIPTFISASNNLSAGRPFGVGSDERWVDVNLSTQTLTAFEGDTAVFSTLISSGRSPWPTVTGQFRIWLRYESQTMDGTRLGYDYYLTGVPYVMYFYQDYALHGTYWHNNFGQPMSHGCVNMETGDAEWLFNFTTIGTVVNVHY